MNNDRQPDDMLSTLEQSETTDQREASARYWYAAAQLADEETREQFAATPANISALRDDLRTLGRSTAEMRGHVDALRRLHANSQDANDPAAAAREALAEAKGRQNDAYATLNEAKAAVKVAEAARQLATLQQLSALDAVTAADATKRRRAAEAKELAKQLLAAGMPEDQIPQFEHAAPKPDIPHRVLAREGYFDGTRLHEQGSVVMRHEPADNRVFRPLEEGEGPNESLRWRVRVLRNHRDPDGQKRSLGEVFEVTDDPAGNPLLQLVDDDTPLGNREQQDEYHNNNGAE